jgi:hypothetical protein
VETNLSASNVPSDYVRRSESTWFFRPFDFVLHNAKPLPFGPCQGSPGF